MPSVVTLGVADALTGSEGNNCIAATAKVGDTIKMGNNRLTVRSLSWISIRCRNPSFPIRALLVPIAQVNSEARMEIPDGWDALKLSDILKSGRVVLHAFNKTIDSHLLLATVDRSTIKSLEDYVKSRQYEVTGRDKGTARAYMFTIIEGEREVVIATAYTSPANFEDRREQFGQIIGTLKGLRALPAELPTTPAASAEELTESAKP